MTLWTEPSLNTMEYKMYPNQYCEGVWVKQASCGLNHLLFMGAVRVSRTCVEHTVREP